MIHPPRMPRPVALLLNLLVLLGLTTVAAAQPQAATVRAVPQKSTVAPGEKLPVAVVLEFNEGWHAWPERGVALPKDVDELAIRTTIEPVGPSKAASGAFLQWPATHPTQVPNPVGDGKLSIPTYSGTAIAFVTYQIDPAAPPGKHTLLIRVNYQACNEDTCLPEDSPELKVSITVDAAAAATAKFNEPDLFKTFDAAAVRFAPLAAPPPADPSKSATTEATAAATASAVVPEPPSLFGFSIPDPSGPIGLLILFLVASLGGAILNLTPCVLPVIPIKIMTLVQHAGSHGRALMLGLWMALGVITFWVVVGLPMAFFSEALDPSRIIFGTWWVTLGLGLLITAMGFGIMGLFTFNLPQSVYMVNPKADTAWGSFVFGIMTAVLGLPCFGFVAGGLLAGAAALGALKIMLIFAGLGVGMALPYLLLSAKPALVDRIPRTGPASELVKQVMGLLLLAAAAFFVAAGIKTLLTDKPYLADSMAWWAVALFVFLAGAWLTIRTLKIAKASWPKVVMPTGSLVAVLAAVVFANGFVGPAREDYLRRQQVLASAQENEPVVTGAWIPYTEQRLAKAIAAGHIVVVDFTADWCINCKAWKNRYLDRDPVRARTQAGDVVLLEVDLSSKKAPGWKFLNSLGQTGVPTLAVFGPQAAQKPIIFNAYKSDTVLNAIDKAKGPAARQAQAPVDASRR